MRVETILIKFFISLKISYKSIDDDDGDGGGGGRGGVYLSKETRHPFARLHLVPSPL